MTRATPKGWRGLRVGETIRRWDRVWSHAESRFVPMNGEMPGFRSKIGRKILDGAYYTFVIRRTK